MKTAIISAVSLLCFAVQSFADSSAAPRPKRAAGKIWRPAQTTLQSAFNIPVTSSGKQTGWINVPVGSTVNVKHVRKTKIMIGLADSEAWVPRAQTDFDQRLNAMKKAKQSVLAQAQQTQAQKDAEVAARQQKAGADWQGRLQNYTSPLDEGPSDYRRSVVDQYDWLGRRYHIGSYGQRIYD